jgi:predicted ATPase
VAALWHIRLLGRLQVVQGEQVVSQFRTRQTAALLAYLGYHSQRSHARKDLIQRFWPKAEPVKAGRASLRQALTSLRHRLEPPGVPPGSVIVTDRATVRLNPATVTTDVGAFREAVQAPPKPESLAQRERRLVEAVELYQQPFLPECEDDWIQKEREALNARFFEALAELLSLLVRTGELARARDYARQGIRLDRPRAEALPVLRDVLESAESPNMNVVPNARPESFGAGEARNTPSPIALPTGTATFLLAEIEAAATLPRAGLEDYHRILVSQFRVDPDVQLLLEEAGSLWVMFGRASAALAAATAGQRALARYQLPGAVAKPGVRMALHTGEILPGQPPLESADFPHVRRLLIAAHGGQILLTERTASFLRAKPPRDVQLVDLGFYCLSQSTQPERLFQANYPGMTPRQFPPPSVPLSGHLPPQFTRFFGRQQEIKQLCEVLLPPGGHLATLTGPGGSGKTRLAVEVAARLAELFHGAVWFVPLLDLSEPRLIVDAMRDALRLPRLPNGEPLEQVEEALSRQRSLLVLDNFEQLLVDGAQTVQALRESVPTLALLVTSRQRLNLPGEREYPAPCLPTPRGPDTPERLVLCESVQLFVDRAQAVRPDFQVTRGNAAAVAALCERLEGIPLALELAAARAQVFTAAQMLAHLKRRFKLLEGRQPDQDRRHRSLWDTLDWSYQLLSPALQQFFTRLSIFRGGWTAAAASAVCAVTDASLTHQYLEQLRGCSLILAEEDRDQMRFRMLETLREYAAQRLTPGEQLEAARRHLGYYLTLAEQAEPKLRGPMQQQWFERLDSEQENLETALAWVVERQDVKTVSRLVAALAPFWRLRGYVSPLQEQRFKLAISPDAFACSPAATAAVLSDLAWYEGTCEGARALQEKILAIRQGLGDPNGIAHSLQALGNLAEERGDYDEAHSFFGESLAIWRELDDQKGIADLLHCLGLLAQQQSDYGTARTSYEEALAIRRTLGDRNGIAGSLHRLGNLAEEQGDYQRARSLQEESLATRRELGYKSGVAHSLYSLGLVAFRQGNCQEAQTLFQESMEIRRAIGNRHDTAMSLWGLGLVAQQQGDYPAARSLFEESLEIRKGLGDRRGVALSLWGLGRVAQRQGNDATARAMHVQSLTIARDLGVKRDIAQNIEGLAVAALAQGQPERAVRLFAAAEALRNTIGAPAPPTDRAEYGHGMATARVKLGDEAFDAARAEGQAMTLEEAICAAIADSEIPAFGGG